MDNGSSLDLVCCSRTRTAPEPHFSHFITVFVFLLDPNSILV